MKITDAFLSILGSPKHPCPDCGADLNSDNTCDECGYGQEGMEDEEEYDEEEEDSQLPMLLEIRDELDRLKKKIDQLITKS